jgi:hypothetical protein
MPPPVAINPTRLAPEVEGNDNDGHDSIEPILKWRSSFRKDDRESTFMPTRP